MAWQPPVHPGGSGVPGQGGYGMQPLYGVPNQPVRPGMRAAQYVRPAGGFRPHPPPGMSAATTPPNQTRQRYAWQDEREHVFSGGAYADERHACTPDDFMKRLEMAEARDVDALEQSQGAAGQRVDQRLFGEGPQLQPLVSRSSKPPPAASTPQRIDPAAAAAQRGWNSRTVGVASQPTPPQEAEPRSAAVAQAIEHEQFARLEAIAASRARAAQEAQARAGLAQPSAAPMTAADEGDWMQAMLQQQPQFRSPSKPQPQPQAQAGAIFPPPCRAIEPPPPPRMQQPQQLLQAAPGSSSPYPVHAAANRGAGAGDAAFAGLWGQHQWQLPTDQARRAGEATFSLFDASAPCAPDHHGGASDARSTQLVGGKLRRNEATNNYETLERPAGAALRAVGSCGGMPGQYAEPQGRKGRSQHAQAHNAHTSSLGGIL